MLKSITLNPIVNEKKKKKEKDISGNRAVEFR